MLKQTVRVRSLCVPEWKLEILQVGLGKFYYSKLLKCCTVRWGCHDSNAVYSRYSWNCWFIEMPLDKFHKRLMTTIIRRLTVAIALEFYNNGESDSYKVLLKFQKSFCIFLILG